MRIGLFTDTYFPQVSGVATSIRTLKTQLWTGGRMMVSRANTLIDMNGEVSDPATLKLVGEFLAEFARHLDSH